MKKRQKLRKTLLFISFLIFPATFYYFSPYLIIDGTLKGIISGSFVLFTLLFVSSLFLGRAYCGWVCPAGGVQDILMEVNDRKIKKGNIIKWLIWVPWVSVIIILAIKKGGYDKIDPFYQTTYESYQQSFFLVFVFKLLSIENPVQPLAGSFYESKNLSPVCFGAFENHKTFLRFIFSQSRLQNRSKYLLECKTESQNLPNNYFEPIAILKTFLRFIFSQSRLQIRSRYLLEDKPESQQARSIYFFVQPHF